LFRLTPTEKQEVVTSCDHLAKLKFSRSLPFAVTEHGAMLASSHHSGRQKQSWSVPECLSHIEAMGGELEIVARFPDGSVKISNFSELGKTIAA
jgi:hypothetical protein